MVPIEFRPVGTLPDAGESGAKPWLAALAGGLRRVRLPDDPTVAAVRQAAERLAQTDWRALPRLLAHPWIAGEAIGDPSPVSALWFRETLLVSGPRARWFDPVAEALARGFPDVGPLRQVIRDCTDRDPAFVADYLAEKFELAPDATPAPPAMHLPTAPPFRAGPADRERACEREIGPAQVTPAVSPECDGTSAHGAVETELSEPARATMIPGPDGTSAIIAKVVVEDAPAERAAFQGEASPAAAGGVPSGGAGGKPVKEKSPVDAAPTGPTLLERFAAASGFVGSEEVKAFHRPDGSALTKAARPFGWELRGPDGQVVRNYAVVDGCLLSGGARVPAEVWNYLKQNPDRMHLIAPALDGSPTDWPGPELVQLKDTDELKVYSREYLLRIDG